MKLLKRGQLYSYAGQSVVIITVTHNSVIYGLIGPTGGGVNHAENLSIFKRNAKSTLLEDDRARAIARIGGAREDLDATMWALEDK